MNAKVIQYSFLLLLAALASCRKELPKMPDSIAPVFFAEVTGLGADFNLEVGMGNVTYSDQIELINGVKVYTGSFAKADTTMKFSFYAGEVFREMSPQEFIALSSTNPVSLGSAEVHQLEIAQLNNSDFESANFKIDGGFSMPEIAFNNPGIYQLSVEATRNSIDFEVTNTVVVAYDNPYTFELQGNINSGGPGTILEGTIANASQNITRIDWTCGTNTLTTSGASVQFPPAGSSNTLTAVVYFEDGTIRTRSIGLGFQNAPKVEDFAYILEQSNPYSFSQKCVLELSINGILYTSLYATEFNVGNPFLNITDKSIYTDPVTQEKAYLIKASGLVYLKNTTTNETIALNLNMSFGLPIEF